MITIAVFWAALFLVTLMLDAPVATWVHNNGIDTAVRDNPLTFFWKFPGNFAFTVLVVIIAMAIGKMDLRDGGFVILCGLFAVADIFTKWIVGRTRPFKLDPTDTALPFTLHPFRNGIGGFFHQDNLSFPSGHEWSAFALAMAIALIRPKWAWVFFVIAIAVGAERVLENAHFISDVFVAMPAAVIGCIVAYRLVRPNEFPARLA
jgi:membrane-associated phospholipid phosphatase